MPNKLFYGRIKSIRRTPSNNLFVEVTDTKTVHIENNIKKLTNHTKRSDMNFLVPRRRERVIETILNLDITKPYIFKLRQETFSKKWCVSEVLEC